MLKKTLILILSLSGDRQRLECGLRYKERPSLPFLFRFTIERSATAHSGMCDLNTCSYDCFCFGCFCCCAVKFHAATATEDDVRCWMATISSLQTDHCHGIWTGQTNMNGWMVVGWMNEDISFQEIWLNGESVSQSFYRHIENGPIEDQHLTIVDGMSTRCHQYTSSSYPHHRGSRARNNKSKLNINDFYIREKCFLLFLHPLPLRMVVAFCHQHFLGTTTLQVCFTLRRLFAAGRVSIITRCSVV